MRIDESKSGQQFPADAQVRSVDAQVRSVDAQVRSVDAQVRSVDAQVPSVDAQVPSADAQVPCSYCGLPTGISGNSSTDVFCCLGCRIASGIVQHDDASGASRWALTRLGLAVFFTMNVMVFTLVLWTWNVHDMSDDAPMQAFREVLRYACLLFASPVLILLGGPLVESSLDALQRRRFTTDVLLLLGVCAAFVYSVYSLLAGLPDVYFEVACMILVAVTFGKWLEATAKFRVTKAMRSLRKLLPETVRKTEERSESVIAIEDVQPGFRLRVLAGERIPVDGVVEAGVCTVDEQIITGESVPCSKQVGEPVYGGTLNLAGDLYLNATTSADTGAIARLAKAVQEATASQCAAIRQADRLAAWFVPAIVLACIAAFWVNQGGGMQHALMASLSVVLIACPCALGIATPLALWVAINSASQNGVLFRNGDAVINLARVRGMAFDKTGTVTSGEIHLVGQFNAPSADPQLIRRVAMSLSSSSNHVLAKAVAAHLRHGAEEPDAVRIGSVQDYPGRGVSGVLDGAVSMLGSIEFARDLGLSISSDIEKETEQHPDSGVVCVGWDGIVQCVFFMGEELRAEASRTFEELRKLKLELAILTGDHEQRASAMQRKTGVTTIGRLLPEDKRDELEKLRRPVAMVGDGMNDAIALAVADVGIALDCGADVSREAADVCLLGSSLTQLPATVRLARATQATITRNLVWAVGYNVVGMGFAVAGMLNPIIAAIAMVGSSLFVLTNSLGLSSGTGFQDLEHKGHELEAPVAPKQDRNTAGSNDRMPEAGGAYEGRQLESYVAGAHND